jgi:hypothetical protein
MHSYNFLHSPDLHVDHLGFHKALCVLMGWNYDKAPDNDKGYQRLCPEEAQANREDLILWPPCVIIHNTNFGRIPGGRIEGFGNKEMDNILRGRYNYVILLLAGILVWLGCLLWIGIEVHMLFEEDRLGPVCFTLSLYFLVEFMTKVDDMKKRIRAIHTETNDASKILQQQQQNLQSKKIGVG